MLPELPEPYIHPKATCMGLVSLGKNVSLWPGAVLRGDLGEIQLGDYVNIQDNTTLHTDSTSKIVIGDWSLVGHNVMIHGARIGRGVLVGIGSILLDHCVVGDGAQIAAGCLIRGKKQIPPRALVVPDGKGIKILPGKADPSLTIAGCIEYVHLAKRALVGKFGPFSRAEEEEFRRLAWRIADSLGIGKIPLNPP